MTRSDSSKSYSRFSIGVGFTSFSLMKYRFPDYKNLNPNSRCQSCSTAEKNTKIVFLFVDDMNINGSYHFSKRMLLKFGIRHLHEEIPGGNDNIEYRGDTSTTNLIGVLRNRYFSIPLSIALKIANNKSESWYTVIETGVNFDFIYREVQSGGSEQVGYVIKSSFAPPEYKVISRIEKPFLARDNKYNFNRISPYVNIYFEWYSRKKTFSFTLGSSFTFESVYQLKNTAEYYKSQKATPTVWGIIYHL